MHLVFFGLECRDLKKLGESLHSQLPGSMSADYKYLHGRKFPHQLIDDFVINVFRRQGCMNFTSQTIPDGIRYIIGVFCYNFKSQMNILVHNNMLTSSLCQS